MPNSSVYEIDRESEHRPRSTISWKAREELQKSQVSGGTKDDRGLGHYTKDLACCSALDEMLTWRQIPIRAYMIIYSGSNSLSKYFPGWGTIVDGKEKDWLASRRNIRTTICLIFYCISSHSSRRRYFPRSIRNCQVEYHVMGGFQYHGLSTRDQPKEIYFPDRASIYSRESRII